MTPASSARRDATALRAACPGAFAAPWPVRLRRLLGWTAFAALFAWCLYDFGFSPARLWTGFQRFGEIASFMFPPVIWRSWEAFAPVLAALGETIAMAFMGTVLGSLLAFPASFLGARTINRFPLLRLTARRGYDIVRAFETLILALIFIRAFGLGPLAGILAIAVSDFGVQAKLFSEALENVSEKPVEGVVASGAGRAQAIRFAILPQVMPVFVSLVLYSFESNVRSSTILGIVGAGGIGFILSDLIAAYHWGEAWSVILLIVVMVYVIDLASARLRSRLIDG
ncbi:phosphonate ABC transporter, permease protein PhnE [Rubrimonas sp.]|uniref:phosphonate ABC transporter, permease protein PhnE n=1 Tax=Rubrimonas sp. TaxID=2036015 RepID=UPI002FDD1AF6